MLNATIPPTTVLTPAATTEATLPDARLLSLVCGEFLEMPGLQLTLAQACRLWNLDSATGAAALETLVNGGFLRRSGACYLRAGSGRLCA
jgi:hypothetical protein